MKPFTSRSIRFGLSAVLVLGIFCLSACDLFKGPNLRALANADVALANAGSFKLTITNIATGTTNPAGSVSVKDGYPTDIVATAQQEVVLIGWRQTGGTGRATLTAVDTTTVRVSLTGGDATIEPVYEVRPIVLYSTPLGNNIAKNSAVRVVFNREVDQAGTDWLSMVKLKQQGTDEIPVEAQYKTGSASITFKPTIASLRDFMQYVVSVRSGIQAKINFDSPAYADVTFLNKAVTTRADYTIPFMTGDAFDKLPPYNTSFILAGADGNTFFSTSSAVFLQHIQAIDDSGDGGVATVHIKNENVVDYPLTGQDFFYDMMLPWTLSDTSEGQYTVSMLFMDVNENLTPPTSAVSNSILIDKTAPVIDAFSIQCAVSSPGWLPNLAASVVLAAHDPTIGAGGFLGSGESENGVDPLEQKSIRFSMDGTTWSDWQAWATNPTCNLASGADGPRTLLVQIRDGVGNTAQASTSVTVDTTAPSASALLSTGTLASNLTNVTLLLSASDAGSGLVSVDINPATTGLAINSAYTAKLGGATTSTGTLNASGNGFNPAGAIPYSDSLDLVLSAGEGTKHVVLDIQDQVGNLRTLNLDIKYDITPPTGSSVSINSGAASTNNTAVSLALSGTDTGGSGLAQVGIQTIQGNLPGATKANAVWVPYSPTVTASLDPQVNNTTQTVYVWFRDAAGNDSASPVSSIINYNNSTPTASLGSASQYTKTGSVALNISASAATNITKVELSNDGASWYQLATPNATTFSNTGYVWSVISGYGATTAQGTHTVWLRITDISGNVTPKSLAISYDSIAPVVSALSLAGTGTGATYLSYASFTFNGSDNLTAANQLKMKYSMDGGVTWTTNYNISGLPYTASYYVANSGYGGGTTAQGTKSVQLRLVDLAGNESASANASIIYDTVAPTVTGVTLSGGAGWIGAASTSVAVTATDATSGFSAGKAYLSNNNTLWSAAFGITGGSFTIPSWDITASAFGGDTVNGAKYVYAKVVDNAGNASVLYPTTAAARDLIGFDNTAPTTGAVAFTGGITSTPSRDISLTLSGSDGGSGLSQMRFYEGGYWSPWVAYATTKTITVSQHNGTKSIKAQFQDAVGNISTSNYSYITLSSVYSSMSKYQITQASMGRVGEDTAYISTVNPNYILLDTSHDTNAFPLMFKTEAGRFGVLSYFISAGKILFYYTTYNSANSNTLQAPITTSPSSYTTSSVYLSLTTGTNYYVNLDSTTWSFPTSNPYTIVLKTTDYLGDMRIYSDGTNIYLYPLESAAFTRY